MSKRCSIRAARIRELNDQLRCKATGGRIVITCGIEALGADGVRNVLVSVAKFDDFTEDNDPWGEHDCAVLTVHGRRIIFKAEHNPDEFLNNDLKQAMARRRTPRDLVARIGGAGALSPTRVPGYAIRTYFGRPSSNIRFTTLTAMATSLAGLVANSAGGHRTGGGGPLFGPVANFSRPGYEAREKAA